MKKRGSTQNKNVNVGVLDEVGIQVEALKGSPSPRADKTFTKVDVNQLHRVFNAREIPVSPKELRSVDWPDISVAHDDLPAATRRAAETAEWFVDLAEEEQNQVLAFLEDLHSLASSMYSMGQAQPIVLERESPDAVVAFIIAGERRSLAGIYSRGKIKQLDAVIWNYRVPPLLRAKLQDAENSEKADLKLHEIITSKKRIWDCLESPEELSLTELSRHWGYSSSSTPSILRALFAREDYESLYARIANSKIALRDIPSMIREVEQGNSTASSTKGIDSTFKLGRGGGGRKPKSEVFGKAEAYGLRLSSKVDAGVPALLLRTSMKSKLLPQKFKDEIGKYDIDSQEGVAAAWAAIGQLLQEDNGDA